MAAKNSEISFFSIAPPQGKNERFPPNSFLIFLKTNLSKETKL